MKPTLILPALLLAATSLQTAAAQESVVLETRQSAKFGEYLTDAEGRALYVFTQDNQGGDGADAESQCFGGCATAWPPLVADSLPRTAGGVKSSMVATMRRDDGTRQVTYSGWPVYRWQGDSGRGEATGQGITQFGGEWFLVGTAGHALKSGQAEPGNPFGDLALRGPECVRHDAEHGRYYISNINGEMTKADNDGFISRVDLDGISELKWIEGGRNGVTLNAPKGMQIFDDQLYVADIDHLRGFDAEIGKALGSVKIEGAEFLNDLAVDDDGTVYVTDTGTKDIPGAIYRVTTEGEVTTVAQGRDLNRPNGIDFDADGNLVVVTFGADEVLTFTTDGTILSRRSLGAGQLDGLIVRDDGSILVSSWKGKHIVRLDPAGRAETVVTGVSKPACFEVEEAQHRLLIPEVRENRIVVTNLPHRQ